MQASFHIKEPTFNDAQALHEISMSLEKYLFEDCMPQWFKDELSVKSFQERIKDKEYEHLVCVQQNTIVGFICIKKNKIVHLFVDEKHHKKGIAKQLWQSIEENRDVSKMTVNASLYAIKVYERFGFETEGEEKNYKELLYQPMLYKKRE